MDTRKVQLSVAELNRRLHANRIRTASDPKYRNLNPGILGGWGCIKRTRVIKYMTWLGLDSSKDFALLCGSYDALIERVISINTVRGYSTNQIKTAVEKIFQVPFARVPKDSFNEVLITAIELPEKRIMGAPTNKVRAKKSNNAAIKKTKTSQPSHLVPGVFNYVLGQENTTMGTIIANQPLLPSHPDSDLETAYKALLKTISSEMFTENEALTVPFNQIQQHNQRVENSFENSRSIIQSNLTLFSQPIEHRSVAMHPHQDLLSDSHAGFSPLEKRLQTSVISGEASVLVDETCCPYLTSDSPSEDFIELSYWDDLNAYEDDSYNCNSPRFF